MREEKNGLRNREGKRKRESLFKESERRVFSEACSLLLYPPNTKGGGIWGEKPLGETAFDSESGFVSYFSFFCRFQGEEKLARRVLSYLEEKMESGFEPQTSHGPQVVRPCKIDEKMVELGSGQFGCAHYRRRCKIRAPCCNEIFDCRHCHNEAKNSIEVDPLDRHEIPRHEVKKVICYLCNTEQDVQQNCMNCGVCMGKYFCEKCNFFDDQVSKNQYHCDGCGICRTGGEENFFHCHTCGCCYAKSLKDSHRCVERAMHHNCPVCFEYLFDSTRDISVLQCGHTIHLDCLKEMEQHFQFACPICSKSVCDMSRVWEKLDQEVAATPMPEIYRNKMVWILCNDCGTKSEVHFHIVAHKCLSCNSYNTKQTRGGPASCSSAI